MSTPLMILYQLVTQDQREKMEMILGMITHFFIMSLLRLHPIGISPLLNLTPLLSLKPLTSLQQDQLLQREQVLLELKILMFRVIF